MIQVELRDFFRGKPEFTLDLCGTEEQLKLLRVRDRRRKIFSKIGRGKDELWICCQGRILHNENHLLSVYGIRHQTKLEYLLNPKEEKGTICLIIKKLTGEQFMIGLDFNEFQELKVWEFKQWLDDKFIKHNDGMRCISGGRDFQDDHMLSQYGLQSMDVIHIVLRLCGGGLPSQDSRFTAVPMQWVSMECLADFNKPDSDSDSSDSSERGTCCVLQ